MEKQSPFCITEAPRVEPRPIHATACGGRLRVAALIDAEQGEQYLGKEVTACGWAKTVRCQGGAGLIFIELHDGSCAKNLQVVIERTKFDDESMKKIAKSTTSTSFKIKGLMVRSPKAGQTFEMQVNDPAKHSVTVIGSCDGAKYPLAKKQHSLEFLREIQHLRPRSYFIGAVARMRTSLAMATHEFFQSRGFQYVHTPLITGADCEGAGEMFQVTTALPGTDIIEEIPVAPFGKKENPATAKKRVDYTKDFFGKKAFLTVSGQLALENYCCALSDVYTFGPTFRSENSHTSRHLAEFWMIEPEMAFAELEDDMECAEAYLRYCVQYVLTRNMKDLEYFEKQTEAGLIERLKNVAESQFARITYTDAVELLKQVAERFVEKNIYWGMDLGSEHERYLAEEHFKKPVIVYNYPYELKAFYMKVNEDGKTVAAMDILAPKVGEVIGGSQREENLEVLDKQIADKGLKKEDYWWYRELRQFGTVPHSGFGLGFERLVMFATGVENIRDVIPFPRYPGCCEF